MQSLYISEYFSLPSLKEPSMEYAHNTLFSDLQRQSAFKHLSSETKVSF